MERFDAIIIGAGAAGLFCAGVAAQRGVRVLLLDHSERVAEKIRISGGGRCNFTNLDVGATHFISQNPHFARSALARYTPKDFLSLLQTHGVAWHEKHKGQLFCDDSAEDIIRVLLAECDQGGVVRRHGCGVRALRYSDADAAAPRYTLDTDSGAVQSHAVVVATGGLSIPKIGATDFGYRIAQQFGLDIVPTRPALVPLTFDPQAWEPFTQLSGLSLPVEIATGSKKAAMRFAEDLLFTHRGLSGPGVLQISSYWSPGTPIRIDLLPGRRVVERLAEGKLQSRKRIANELASLLPSRLADTWVARGPALGQAWDRPVSEASDKALSALGESLNRWEITPTGTEGYRKAEVTAGGVDTRCLSGQTLESRQPGLYFIGEVVDVTGWLGGYNFQWAWASAHACAHALPTAPR